MLGLAGSEATGEGALTVAVPVMPRISNFDDLDPLRAEPGVRVVLVRPGETIPAEAALVLLPGSKTTIDDLLFLQAEGWDVDIRAHCRRGGHVLGLCGGYQMLGRRIRDPHGIEGPPRDVPGLGLLDVETVLTADKRLACVAGTTLTDGLPFTGYEMHVGDTAGRDAAGRSCASRTGGRTGRSRRTGWSAGPTSTGSSPTTPSAGRGSRGSGRAASAPPTRPGSRRPSTGSRDTSRPTSIATGCSPSRARPGLRYNSE